VLEDYIAAVEAAQARRDRLTAQIEAMLADWTLAPVVAALQTEAPPNWWTPLLSSGGSGKVSNGPGTSSFYG